MLVRTRRLKLFLVIAACFGFGLSIPLGHLLLESANAAAPPKQSSDTNAEHKLQRSYLIDHYEEVADSGPERGENIYFHKCWVCHNQYYKPAPHLTAVMQSGGPDESTLTNTIRDGNAGMPSFKTTLSDADIHDV